MADKVTSGQRVGKPSASLHNTGVDVADHWRRKGPWKDAPPNHTARNYSKVKVKNKTGSDLRRGEVVELSSFLLNEIEQDYLWFGGVVPDLTHVGWGITLKPIIECEIDEVLVLGACMAYVNILSESHEYADRVDGSVVLQSATSGPVKILHKKGTETERECVVQIMDEQYSSSAEEIDATTTTLEPCSGRCKWIWDDTAGVWDLETDGCGGTTTTTTTSTADPSTTTTADPCGDVPLTTTTTTSSTTTTTPEPSSCACTYPTHCGETDGECTYTDCASGYVAQIVSCNTTADCNCDTTTTTPDCSTCADWVCTPDGWLMTANNCTGGCAPVEPETDCTLGLAASCGEVQFGSFECVPCAGTCNWIYYDDYGWWLASNSCDQLSCGPCQCVKPTHTGTHCGNYTGQCQSPEPVEPCAHCYSTTTTTAELGSCGGECKWQWDTGTETWTVTESSCEAGCACLSPAFDGTDSCEVVWTYCSSATTTTTTTTTTADPGCCPTEGRCVYSFNFGTREFELILDSCGEGCECPAVISQCLPCMDSLTAGTYAVQTACGLWNSDGPNGFNCSESACASGNCDDYFNSFPYPANPSFYSYTCGGGDCFGGPTTTTTTTAAP